MSSYFLPDNLNGEMYIQLLEEAINPTVTDIIENTTPHNALIVHQYLDQSTD